MINFNMIQYKQLKGFENKLRQTYINSFPLIGLHVFTRDGMLAAKKIKIVLSSSGEIYYLVQARFVDS